MPKMKTSFTGLVKLLAKSLYPEPDVFIRELIQNAHDSIKLRRMDTSDLSGRIEIFTDSTRSTISFEDNGRGMDRMDIEELLSTIGRSGTGEAKQTLKNANQVVETIGQFGIGLLSAFVVADKIEVFTKKEHDTQAWHWTNHGGENYELEPNDHIQATGTKVVVTLGKKHQQYGDEKTIKEAIKKYADFLPFRIDVNGNGPVNTISAPWHGSAWGSEEEYDHALREFVNKRFPDSALLVIPINLEYPEAKGVLYISDQHIPAISISGVVDIYQERMSIRPNDSELLPDWAKFIRGIVDSPAVSPTAARDNLIKDDTYYRLRAALGELITQALIKLSKNNRRRFLNICKWHHYHLKGMASHSEDFFAAVIEHLPFETNQGDLTFEQIIRNQPAKTGSRIPIYYFSYGYDSNQFYELCNAKNLISINTGATFDETLVKKYVEQHKDTLELCQLDVLDSPDLYQHLNADEVQKFYFLESALRRALERVGIPQIHPTTRRFLPVDMSAVILNTQRVEARDTMEALLSQPFMLDGLGEMADEMREELRRAPLDLYLNAGNELVQKMAELENLDDPKYQSLLIGLYNGAILYSQHRMTPENAKIFYMQMQKQIGQILKLEVALAECHAEKRMTQLRLLEQQADAVEHNRSWVQIFIMMPYDKAYDPLEEALRDILERPPYCFQLVLARNKTLNFNLRGNLRRHIRNSDGFIADISKHSANVFMELGWVYFEPDFEQRPIMILCNEQGQDPPVDLEGHVVHHYSEENIKSGLAKHFEAHEGFETLLAQRQARFFNKRLLEDSILSSEAAEQIASVWDTVEEVLNASAEEFSERMREQGLMKYASAHQMICGQLQEI
ncbi:MAG: ATP-binding protein [Desulfobacter sp.]